MIKPSREYSERRGNAKGAIREIASAADRSRGNVNELSSFLLDGARKIERGEIKPSLENRGRNRQASRTRTRVVDVYII